MLPWYINWQIIRPMTIDESYKIAGYRWLPNFGRFVFMWGHVALCPYLSIYLGNYNNTSTSFYLYRPFSIRVQICVWLYSFPPVCWATHIQRCDVNLACMLAWSSTVNFLSTFLTVKWISPYHVSKTSFSRILWSPITLY